MRIVSSLWHDDAGFIVSAELVVLGTLLVVGLLAGMTCMQEAVIGEYQEVGGAITSLDQSYSYNGMHGCFQPQCWGFGSWTAGSAYPASNAVVPVVFDYTLLPVPAYTASVAVAPSAIVTPPIPALCPPETSTVAPYVAAAPAITPRACPNAPPGRPCPVDGCVDTGHSVRANNYNDYGYADPRPQMGPLVW